MPRPRCPTSMLVVEEEVLFVSFWNKKKIQPTFFIMPLCALARTHTSSLLIFFGTSATNFLSFATTDIFLPAPTKVMNFW